MIPLVLSEFQAFLQVPLGSPEFLQVPPRSPKFPQWVSQVPGHSWTHHRSVEEKPVPTRAQQLKRLASGEEFDVLVVGGGCTGAGVALEAQLRGLKVACVEQTLVSFLDSIEKHHFSAGLAWHFANLLGSSLKFGSHPKGSAARVGNAKAVLMASTSVPTLPISSKAFDLSFSNEKVVRGPSTPISQTTRSPSCQSYVSGEAWEDVLRKVGPGLNPTTACGGCGGCGACGGCGGCGGCGLPYNWPATPSPHSTYKPSFGMPPIPCEESTRTSLNVHAREFVPFSKMNVQRDPMISEVPSRAWDELEYPSEEPGKLRSLEICLPWEGFMPKEVLKAPECAKAPSKGSALHGTGHCKPCAWFWKPRGCSNASDCSYCHACPAGALKERKKAKVAAIRAGIIEPRGKVQK
eukprot:Skav230183  [mRNA]  locus=scaffold196:169519:170923:- [translate_table: standard]